MGCESCFSVLRTADNGAGLETGLLLMGGGGTEVLGGVEPRSMCGIMQNEVDGRGIIVVPFFTFGRSSERWKFAQFLSRLRHAR
jgi:hypothetical protein